MKKVALMFFAAAVGLTSCTKDENGNFTVNIDGLQDIGPNYRYEGWLIVDGSPKSAGIFDVDADGNLSATSFEVDKDYIEGASAYVLTIEPFPDSDPAPSSTHILAGDFSGSSAALTVGHGSALGSDFTSATGSYILATPTDGMMNNENSGLWFLDPAAGPGASLNLPTLPDGWVYEGWAVINGSPVSTGTFTDVAAADAMAPYSGTMAGPPFPGEDFLMNAPAGQTFPTDLAGGVAVISIEPYPDNSADPFVLKPLVGMIDANAVDHTSYSMGNNAAATNPTGTVTK